MGTLAPEGRCVAMGVLRCYYCCISMYNLIIISFVMKDYIMKYNNVILYNLIMLYGILNIIILHDGKIFVLDLLMCHLATFVILLR